MGGREKGRWRRKKVKKKSSPLLSLSLFPRLGFSASERSFLSLCSTPPAPSLCAPSFTLPPSRSPHAVHHVDSFARAARRSLLLERQDGLQQGIIDDAASADGSSFPSRRRSRAASSRPGQGLAEVLCLRSRFRAPRRGELSCRMRLFCDVGGRKREGEAKRRFRLSLFFQAAFYREACRSLARSLVCSSPLSPSLSALSFSRARLRPCRPSKKRKRGTEEKRSAEARRRGEKTQSRDDDALPPSLAAAGRLGVLSCQSLAPLLALFRPLRRPFSLVPPARGLRHVASLPPSRFLGLEPRRRRRAGALDDGFRRFLARKKGRRWWRELLLLSSSSGPFRYLGLLPWPFSLSFRSRRPLLPRFYHQPTN